MPLAALENAPIQDSHVLLFVDFNVPMNGVFITCPFKIDSTLKTIDYIIKAGCASLTITTHLGRPKDRSECSTRPIFKYLAKTLSSLQYVNISAFIDYGTKVHSNELIFTDNLRYYSIADIDRFCKLFDVVVNDAFGAAHRKHTEAAAYPGLLMSRELEKLGTARKSDLVIMGGAKMGDKLAIIDEFQSLVFVAGCLSLTILKSLGYEVGLHTKVEEYDNQKIRDRVLVGEALMRWVEDAINSSGDGDTVAKVVLPLDFYVLEHPGDKEGCFKPYNNIGPNDECVDIGPRTVELLGRLVRRSKSILWNGPLGKIEDSPVANSTCILIKLLEDAPGMTFIGGGETTECVTKYSNVARFTHVSTGGGAMLRFFSGSKMIAVEKLIKRKEEEGIF